MEDELLDATWKKVVRQTEKVGLREGIADGRASVFQKSFDSGYVEGFKNGFLLGKLKGENKLQHSNETKLRHTRRGNCVICADKTLLETTCTEDIIRLQIKTTEDFLKQLE